MQFELVILQMLRLTPRKHCTCRQNHSKSLLLGLRSHHWLHWVAWAFENTAPVGKSEKTTLENTAPVDKTEEATLENTAPVDKSEEPTLENTVPVDKSETATLENITPVDKSIEITAAEPSKPPLTVLSSDLIPFVRKRCTPLEDLSTSQSTVISSTETSKSLFSVLSYDLPILPSRSLHCFERAFEVSIDCAQFWPTYLSFEITEQVRT